MWNPRMQINGANVRLGRKGLDSRSLNRAQQMDPACQEELSWFRGDLTLSPPPTLHPKEAEGEIKWFAKRYSRPSLVQYDKVATLLAILAETKQGEKAEIAKKSNDIFKKIRLLCQFPKRQR